MVKQNSKIIIWVILAVVLTLLISAYFFYYMPKQNRIADINDYKRGLYQSSLCQYTCPLTMQTLNNLSQILPEVNCVQNCSAEFKAKFGDGESFSNKELENDDLFKDVLSSINACKTLSAVNSTLNNSLFFPCVSEKMISLNQTYLYLNN
jgi:hypothetical protein